MEEDEWLAQEQQSEIDAENAWLRHAEAGCPDTWADEEREKELERNWF